MIYGLVEMVNLPLLLQQAMRWLLIIIYLFVIDLIHHSSVTWIQQQAHLEENMVNYMQLNGQDSVILVLKSGILQM